MVEPTKSVQPPPPVERGGEDQVYRPLSLTAVAGFALACLYAGFLAICTVVALVTWTPLLMTSWVLLWPILALVVSWIARTEVQRSEGTRAGGALANYGMLISLVSGLIYTSYLVASYFAVLQGAQPVGEQYLRLVCEGQLDKAYRMTRSPGERASLPTDDPVKLRNELELRFNTDPRGQTGNLSVFESGMIIRALQQAGPDAVIRPGKLKDWEYTQGGYRVQQQFQITGPEATFDVVVTTRSSETGGEGREWTVDSAQQANVPPRFTPLGNQRNALREDAMQFSAAWEEKIQQGKWEEAYLETQPPARRAELRAEFRKHAAEAPDVTDPEEARLKFLPGYRDFRQGSLVVVDPAEYWAPAGIKAEVPPRVKQLFAGSGEAFAQALRPDPPGNRLVVQEGKQLQVILPHALNLAPQYMGEANLIVETDADAVESGKEKLVWRVVALRLHRARNFIAPAPPR